MRMFKRLFPVFLVSVLLAGAGHGQTAGSNQDQLQFGHERVEVTVHPGLQPRPEHATVRLRDRGQGHCR